ncbi:MAG TPA: DNA translocase FtsK, partial [Lentisphaeria bacterium]|nr:DNA translocase FtsK [Lentisphaeria bacterium]
PAKMPYIVLIIDELADIMLTCRTEVETGLARIAQMSRAVGIHAIVATQRPSVNIITGVIKANFPTRIAFQVSSQVDSRTIIDGKGAESLLGAGDMLFKPPTASRLQRLQGTMVTDAEIERVVRYCSAQGDTAQNFDLLKTAADAVSPTEAEDFEEDDDGFDNGNDSLLRAAMEIVIRDQKASISYIQRRLRIGYNKAATLMEQLEKRGVVGPQVGMLPREILVDSMESAVDDEDY